MFSGYDFDVIQRSWVYLFREGMTFTVTLTLMAMTGGIIFGTLLAMMRLSKFKVLGMVAGGYVNPASYSQPVYSSGSAATGSNDSQTRSTHSQRTHTNRGTAPSRRTLFRRAFMRPCRSSVASKSSTYSRGGVACWSTSISTDL